MRTLGKTEGDDSAREASGKAHAQGIVGIEQEERVLAEVSEEFLFLVEGILQAPQAAYVSFADNRENSVIGANHRFEALHLARKTDTGLYHRDFVFGPHSEE